MGKATGRERGSPRYPVTAHSSVRSRLSSIGTLPLELAASTDDAGDDGSDDSSKKIPPTQPSDRGGVEGD